jgi:hypothetical protein
MSDNWQYKITHVTPGEPVQAGIVSRPDRALADRTDYLKERLDAAEAGKAIFDLDATVAVDVLPGHAVYWNAAAKQYERAIVVVENDEASQTLVSRPSSDCVGLCYSKTAVNKADIVLRGLVSFKNLTNSIGEIVEPGKYYLSAVTPGKLAQQKPPITVTVCYVLGPRDNCSDELRVIVCPQVRDSLDEHTHFRFDLTTRPAGNVTAIPDSEPERLQVSGDDTQAGWLPANHSSFNGKAPAGAKFGYNIRKHPTLSRVWPPIPIQSVALLWDKGENLVGATEVPLGATGAAIIDVNGIWWMSNCREDVPWPENYNATITAAQCPREEKMRVVLVFLRLLLGNNRRVVTSLDKDILSPIQITNCDDIVAQTGDLKLDLDLQEIDCAPLTEADHSLGVQHGGKVYTDIIAPEPLNNPNKNQLKKSWVTEGIVAHNLEQLTVTGSWQRMLTDEEKVYHGFTDGSNAPVAEAVFAQQGLIRVDFDDQFADRELSPQIIRLDDAVERLYLDIPYLGFPQGQDSSIRVRLNVPYVNVLSGGTLQMKMRVQLFTRGGVTTASGSVGQLLMTYRVIHAPATGALALPTTEVEVGPANAALFPAGLTAPRDAAIQADSLSFSVLPGDTVLVTFARPKEDVTAGELGILRVSGILFKT